MSFSGCPEVTDIGVKEVVDCMRNLVNLRRIGIAFEECEKITDESSDYLVQYLKTQFCLERISLGFVRYATEEEEELNEFEKEIENLKIQRPDIDIEWRPL